MLGFKLKEDKFIKELNTNVLIYKHVKTGAQFIHLNNDDTNKLFSVAFRTPPTDNTGIAHIVEHSVLCGSEKYPVKSPYREMRKGSLYTFLNALTKNDFTVYPVASTNDKDFLQLAEVYIDAVFFPRLHTVDDIFYQEGWHYNLDSLDAELEINGVVYNEMLGASSDFSEIVNVEMRKALFPNTFYRYESGGIPDNILELTIDKFRCFHKEYYHPSNAFFFFYGDIHIDEMLEMIDRVALKKYDKVKINSKNIIQPFFESPVEYLVNYPETNNSSLPPFLQEQNDSEDVKHSLGFMLDLKNDPNLYFDFKIIWSLLFDSMESPVRKALVDSGVCDDVSCYFDTDTLQPSFRVTISGSRIEDKEKFKKVFFDTLEKLCREGIDKKMIKSAIAIEEFDLREANHPIYPRGLVYLLDILPHWMHGFDPIAFLSFEQSLNHVRTSLTENHLEKLIKAYFLENQHYALISFIPQKGLTEDKENLLKENLANKMNNMNNLEKESILELTKKLLDRQTSIDSEKALSSIPAISIKDLNRKEINYSFQIEDYNKEGFYFHKHESFTNGIVYLKIYFDSAYVPQELIQYVKLLTAIIGNVNTKNYASSEIAKEIDLKTGGIGYEYRVFENQDNLLDFKPYFTINSKAIPSQTESMIDLIFELIKNTIFNDTKQLKNVLLHHKSILDMMVMNISNMYSHLRLSSYLSSHGRFREYVDGIEYYLFMKDLLSKFDDNPAEIIKNIKEAYRYIFNKKNIRISLTATKEDIEKTKHYFYNKLNELDCFHCNKQKYSFKANPKNEAFIIPSRVQYIAKGFYNSDAIFNGELKVLEKIIGLDYLWNKIRVQGGAYGTSFDIESKGNIIAASMRDPNLIRTLDSFDGIIDYLKNLDISDKELDKYVISAIRESDSPKTSFEKSCLSDQFYLSKITQDMLQANRELILDVSVIKLKNYIGLLENVMKQNCYCVFGSEAKINENKHLFNKIINV